MNLEKYLVKSPMKFYLLVFIFSIPFWLFGSIQAKWLPMNLPLSALMFICPLISALILTYREVGTEGINRLLKRTFDYKRIKEKTWYLPIFFLMPIILFLSYVVIRLIGRPLPNPQILWLEIPILFVMFFIAALCEEIGWMGYAIEPMLKKWSALEASIIMGILWAIWHIIPFIQTKHSMLWIIGQCYTTVLLRVFIVWVYNNTGKSVFAAILFHDMTNVSDTLFPNNGSHYDPIITGLIMTIVVVIILLFWDLKNFARYKKQH